MRTSGIRPSDVVMADVRGQKFFARVVGKAEDDVRLRSKPKGTMRVEPLKPSFHIPTTIVTPRQVKEHYSKRKG